VEFVVGLACFAIGGTWAAEAVRRGGRVMSASLWAAAALQVLVLGTLWLDWGYSWVEETALHLALEKNVWVAIPHAFALLTLLGLLRWGLRFTPWALVLSAIQAAMFIPVLLSVERNTSMSFLAAAPMVAMFAATLAAFLFLPGACLVIPGPGSRWHRIAFGPRQGLIAAIEDLRGLGLHVTGPGSVFESGAATGRVGRAEVVVTTLPQLYPPAYGLKVRLRMPPGVVPVVPGRPGFAPRERVAVVEGVVEYEGWTPAGFDVGPERFRAFLLSMASGA